MKKLGAAALLAAVIFGAGAAAPASASAASPSANTGSYVVQPYGIWPGPI